MAEKLLQWHAAFFAGIQIELEEEAEYLIFENEHMLGTKPMQVDELTVSFVCSHYPRELIKHLVESQNRTIAKNEPGIYYILGDIFPIQILVTTELSEESNLWLRNLSNNIQDTESAERLVRAYENKKNNRLYSSVMDIVVRANAEKFEEVRTMCDALNFKNLIRKKVLKNKSLEQIADELEAEIEEILPIYNRVKEAIA